MSRSGGMPPGITVRRLGLLIVIAAVATTLILGTFYWIQRHVPQWVFWKTGLIFLIAAEITYCIMAAATLIGALVLGALIIERRRNRTARRKLARGILLCASLAIALVLAEAASGIQLYLLHRNTAIPVGGLRQTSDTGKLELAPVAAANATAPTTFPNPPGDREIDIAVFGESSAEGVPYNQWVSVGAILRWQLGEVFSDRPVGLQVLAEFGHTLELQQARLSFLSRRPDLLVIYCGHNEITGRMDSAREPRHYFDERLPTAWSILVEQIEAISPLCGLIRETADKCRIAIAPPAHGHRRLIDVPAYTTTEYTTLLTDFRRRLDAMVSYAEQIGAMPVLIAPPANDAGFEPTRSFLPAVTPRSEREAFARDFLAARRREAADPRGALLAYQALLTQQPGFAEAHYRLAQLLERAGAWDEAYRHYQAARDFDGFPMRCLTTFHAVYHEVADRHRCILIDGQSYFHAIGRHGLLDDDLFHDGIHPSLRGQIALAQAVLHELRERTAFGWPWNSPAPIIDPSQCAQHFRLDPLVWEYISTSGARFYDLTYPLRYDSTRRLEKRMAFLRATDRLKAGDPPESVGLPNIGVPEPVPAASSNDIRGSIAHQSNDASN
jgi:lysophospholipase L1-like esterase